MDLKRMSALRKLAQMKQDIELAKLSGLIGAERAIETQKDALRVAEKEAWDAVRDAPGDGLVFDSYRGWVSKRQEALDVERARLEQEIAMQRDDAAKALGRAEVMKTIIERGQQERAVLKMRKSSSS